MSRIKGWCPSAHAPMMSGDGLLVRIKPRLGRLTAEQGRTVCDLAARFGNGLIDLTSRANLQLRGVSDDTHAKLLSALIDAGLVDPDPGREARRNIVVTPYWQPDDLNHRLSDMLETIELPDLPDKMGIAVDTGPAPMLPGVSGDFRFERDDRGDLILRADGAAKGRRLTDPDAAKALQDLVTWFLETGGAGAGRMARHLKTTPLPNAWQQAEPAPSAERPVPGAADGGGIYGVPFGQTTADDLLALIEAARASHIRITPWRMLFLEGAVAARVPGFLSGPDPLLDVAACPGAPACAEASIATRDLAAALAGRQSGTLHVSGCAKGCARPSPAAITLVGRKGRFDLVQQGHAGDTPVRRGLSETEVRELFD